MDSALRFELLADAEYAAAQPINLTFRLTNDGSNDAWVLTWYTPLEGIKGNIFDVTCSGNRVGYEGRMMKRGDPTAEDYVHLAAGETASACVDLTEGYPLRNCDPCVVGFSGVLSDVVWGAGQHPRTQNGHQQMAVEGNTVSFRVGA